MNDRELMQQALEALEHMCRTTIAESGYNGVLVEQAIEALHERLAQPEQEAKLSCGVDYADGLLTVSVVRGHADGSMEVIHCDQIAMPIAKQPAPQRTHWDGCDEVHPECRRPEQEPVAWVSKTGHGTHYSNSLTPQQRKLEWAGKPVWTPLYTTPPRREWVGLTPEERESLWGEWENEHVVEAIEAKLREKNQ